jgi:hypothetical protein
MKVFPGEQLWDILQTRMQNHPQSQEYLEADKRLDAIVKRLSRTVPHDRHELRQKALYVEPTDSGTAWNRPKDQTKEEAYEQLRVLRMRIEARLTDSLAETFTGRKIPHSTMTLMRGRTVQCCPIR